LDAPNDGVLSKLELPTRDFLTYLFQHHHPYTRGANYTMS
jgi:hypothetical protein